MKWGARSMPADETAFVARIRDQLRFLRDGEYAYNELRIYLSGIGEPWTFGPNDEFEFSGDQVLVVRTGPTREYGNAEVPEFVFPVRHIVATELGVSGG
jgi:hypothetical protein